MEFVIGCLHLASCLSSAQLSALLTVCQCQPPTVERVHILKAWTNFQRSPGAHFTRKCGLFALLPSRKLCPCHTCGFRFCKLGRIFRKFESKFIIFQVLFQKCLSVVKMKNNCPQIRPINQNNVDQLWRSSEHHN